MAQTNIGGTMDEYIKMEERIQEKSEQLEVSLQGIDLEHFTTFCTDAGRYVNFSESEENQYTYLKNQLGL